LEWCFAIHRHFCLAALLVALWVRCLLECFLALACLAFVVVLARGLLVLRFSPLARERSLMA
jgi:hypothetical protein